jgi:hypothetical protein
MVPRDIVCLRNISVDTLHKGYKEDNNDKNNNNISKCKAIHVHAVRAYRGSGVITPLILNLRTSWK